MGAGLMLVLAGILALALALPVLGADELVLKNAALSRTITSFAGPLRTTKLEANGVQMLAAPGVEFLIDIDYKKEPITLTPGDFDIEKTDTAKIGQESQVTIKLRSHRPDVPMVAYLKYHSLPDAPYIQKSLTITPVKELPGAVLRRVTLEYCQLKPEFAPVTPVDRYAGISGGEPKPDLTEPAKRFEFGQRSEFAAIDAKAGKGVFFFVGSLFGRETYSRSGHLVLAEDAFVPLEKGYETSRATIGAVAGPPEVLYKRFRELLWNSYSVIRGKPTGATVLRSDGSEWSEARASESQPAPAKPQLFAVLSRCQAKCEELRKANKDLIIRLSQQAAGQLPYVHLLNAIDQIEFPGSHQEGSLGARQRRYNQAFVLPPYTIDTGQRDVDLDKPFPQARYAIVSTLSDPPQTQAARRTSNPSAEMNAYLERFDAFGKRFRQYFEIYQHVLDFPDGQRVDGEGHILNNKGFIILYNPSDQPQKVALPLDEPELELKGDLKLSDWTELDSGADMGRAKPGDKIEVELGPVSAKIIGINIVP